MIVIYIVGMAGSSGTSVLFFRTYLGRGVYQTVLGMAGSSGTSVLFSRTYLGKADYRGCLVYCRYGWKQRYKYFIL